MQRKQVMWYFVSCDFLRSTLRHFVAFSPRPLLQPLCVPRFVPQGDRGTSFLISLLFYCTIFFDICQKKEKRSKKEKRVQEIQGKKLTKKIRRNKMKLLVEMSGGFTNGEKENTRSLECFSFDKLHFGVLISSLIWHDDKKTL